MARINLLPWREELRKQRRQQFIVVLGLAVVLAGVAMAGVHFFVDGQIQFQRERNAYLDGQIHQLDQQIKEIRSLEATRKRLEARINIIQQLQASRPEFVHLFDELVKTLPDGVYLTKMEEKGSGITLNGIAQSNARVSNYMWNLEKSGWLADPDLRVIKTVDKDGARVSEFVLHVVQSHKKEKGKVAENKK
ncbi:MAG: PilN domain-containing protein [Gammaproteobacteria bacterium]|jgi:type IV pilus assembly protein PilN